MAQQWNAIIAKQIVPFRGTSAISIVDTAPGFPNFRAITGAAYAVNVSGGVSGSFGVHVLGSIGGTTYTLAGLTTLAAGSFVLYPTFWTNAGAQSATETALTIASNRIDQIVPPSVVVFQSATATAGISATITVSAALYANR